MQNQQPREPVEVKEAASILKIFPKLPEAAKAYIEGFGAGILQEQAAKQSQTQTN